MNSRTHPIRHLARWVTAIALIVGTSATAAFAQSSDDEWLEDCRDRRQDRETHCIVKVERMNAGGTLRVDAGRNGGVMVYGSDRSDVEVHARIRAWAETAGSAESLATDVRLQLGPASIQADGPSARDREGWSVTFVVFVPRMSDLDLRANNGPVSATAVSGAIEAHTRNGPVALHQVAGNVTARTQNGPITVELNGSRWSGEGLDAETRNGPVTLAIPENYNARLETGTVNGPLNTDIPLTVELMGRLRNRRIEATLGSGGPLIRAVTTNGPVSIRKTD